MDAGITPCAERRRKYHLPVPKLQRSRRALLYALPAADADIPGFRIMAVSAVKVTPLQKYCRPIARPIHRAEWYDLIYRYTHHLSDLPFQNLSIMLCSHPKGSRILKHIFALLQLLDFRTLHQVTGDTDHIAVGRVE